MTDYSVIFQPFVDLFNQAQVQTILLAWLPTKIGHLLPGIMAVDMFITTIIASGLTVLCGAIYAMSQSFFSGKGWGTSLVTVQIEYYVTALSWIISKQTKKLEKGSFIVQPTNEYQDNDDDECAPPTFNILPEANQQISIEYKGRKFNVTFNMPEGEIEDSNSDVDSIAEFINEVTRAYLESQKRDKIRARYERTDGYWYRVQSLSSIRGLETVALDETQEQLLKKELDTFVNDKDFYGRIGMPYRRGFLLFGKPGTGKTSLINAISSQLSRDLYYINLKNIVSDNEMSAAFSSVPSNQIIVLEDVDAQSKVLHKRRNDDDDKFSKGISSDDNKGGKTGSGFSMISLSNFLGCLDGHIMSEGNIIIMTTNHADHLDPACIRPGRMDVHLNLEYCTHYQIKKMYRSVVEDSKAEFPEDILQKIPERLLPPCEVMMTMVLYRNDIELIPEKVCDLVKKYKDMKPEDIAKQMEEEARRIEAASKQPEKEETKSEETKSESKETKTEETKSEGVKSEATKTDDVKSEATKTDDVKSEATKTDDVKSEATKTDDVKSEATKTDDVKSEATKADEETKVKKAEDEEKKKDETLKVENKLNSTNMTRSSSNRSETTCINDEENGGSGNTTDVEVDDIQTTKNLKFEPIITNDTNPQINVS
ncbi:15077_t:CDS:2 [Dentiscutata erythropus]|uniref:15077_t:CDS:1 n=1 Tax=Dentiscutata erythropus TaxID=1348616 RepID=A0A9N9N5W8_9GLOM|nr:15077_t:CDS:2 [Dentiscutata erythropus]